MSGDRLSQVVFILVIQALSKLIVELLVWVSKKIAWVKKKIGAFRKTKERKKPPQLH